MSDSLRKLDGLQDETVCESLLPDHFHRIRKDDPVDGFIACKGPLADHGNSIGNDDPFLTSAIPKQRGPTDGEIPQDLGMDFPDYGRNARFILAA